MRPPTRPFNAGGRCQFQCVPFFSTGLKRHAYMCSACGDIEQRTVFNKQAKEKHDAEMAAALAPPIVPTATIEKQPTAQGFFGRFLAKIRGQ
jgi:hypothetical protein